MSSRDELTYWQRRLLEVEEQRLISEEAFNRLLRKRYRKFSREIEKEIREWLEKYAINDSISLVEAQKMLSKPEQRQWSMEIKEFRRKAIDGGYTQELNREYYKSRVNRLEKLKGQLHFELAGKAFEEVGHLTDKLAKDYVDTKIRTSYEITDRGAPSAVAEIKFSKINMKELNDSLKTQHYRSHFSKRVWRNHLKVIPTRLNKVLTQGMANGWSIDKMVDEMMQGIDTGLRNRMTTLVQTESSLMADDAKEKSFKEAGIEKYQWLATLEISTCDQCADLDLEEFDVGDKDAPRPIKDTHPNCRCTRVAKIEGSEIQTRWHRDPATGKGGRIKRISYSEWYKMHVTDAVAKRIDD